MSFLQSLGVLALTLIGLLVLVLFAGLLAGLSWYLFEAGWNLAPK